MKRKEDSAPIQLLQLIWENATKAAGDSWRRYNESLANGLSLAIRSGMRFEPDDFKVIEERYRPEYWMGLGSDSGERYFTLAVVNDNISAAVAFEKWKGREPFIWNDIRADDTVFEGFRRLFVGAWFTWQGEHVSLTKFVNDDDSIRACSYVQEKGKPWHWSRSKILHRYVIKRAELLAIRKGMNDQKKAKTAEERIKAVDERKLEDAGYLKALLDHTVGREHIRELRKSGVIVAFWRSDADGKPCNSGTGGPRRVGMLEEEKGPLVACQKGALHATMRPESWRGERLWAVALHPPVIRVDDEKYASLKREILAEIKVLPPYKELLGMAQASVQG